MDDRFDALLTELFDTEGFFPDDRLTQIIDQETDSEIDIEYLDYVAAARKTDFQQFLKKAENET